MKLKYNLKSPSLKIIDFYKALLDYFLRFSFGYTEKKSRKSIQISRMASGLMGKLALIPLVSKKKK